MTKFTPISGPPDHYSGPATGLSTEKGDSWMTAVEKINASFRHIYALMTDAAPPTSQPPTPQTGSIASDFDQMAHGVLKDEVAALRAKVDHYGGVIDALLEFRGTPGVPIPASTEGRAPGAGSA